ncbi:MAG: Dolichyl-phosphate-mannose--protein O-mannosyl transferase [Jatrophihabitantaceae bacterium]|nr:Dolichyl-phosphate-mannose--protein O-mannosyl transferase [Jatrophihabitantaceae bacterium]
MTSAARRRAPWWIPALVGAAALVLRAIRLASPDVYVFDEIYYAGDAASLLRSGVERGTPAHPPLGKWLIALGIHTFGMNPTGWRISAAIAGSVLCAVIAVIAWRLTRRPDLAILAGVLASVDGILFTSSRVAMLDIFEALFVVAAVHACIVAFQSPTPSLIRRWHLLGAVWLGLGAAVKWSALFTVPVLIAVVVVQLWRGPAAPASRRALALLIRLAVAGGLTIASYLLAYTPTFVTHPGRANPAEFVREQRRLLEFHLHLTPRNAYAHPAVDWLAQRYPTGLFGERCTVPMGRVDSAVCPSGHGYDTTVSIVSVANPVVWLLGVIALAVLVGGLVYRFAVGPLIVGGAVLTRWLPWLGTRDGYSFYAASLIPFLILAIVLALHLLPPRAIRWSALAIGVLAVAAFAFFYPYWAAVPLSGGQLDLRQWLSTWP